MHNNLLDNDKKTTTYDGFYRGIVVDTNDPLQSGRIQIRVYPMFKGVLDADLPWAIKADPEFGGAANVGGSRVPEIGAHVYVFFESGDHRYPVYFAGAPAIQAGEPDIPQLSREDDNTVSSINSNRSTGVTTASGGSWSEPQSAYNPTYPHNKVYRSASGVIIEIDDTDGNTRLHLYHPSGTRHETDNSGNLVEHVEATKTTVIVGDDNIHVQGKHDTTVDGSHGIRIGTNGQVTVGGNYTITVTGNATVNASGNVVVSGATILLN